MVVPLQPIWETLEAIAPGGTDEGLLDQVVEELYGLTRSESGALAGWAKRQHEAFGKSPAQEEDDD